MYRRILLFMLLAHTVAAQTPPTALRDGHLLLFLHETTHIPDEATASKQVGSSTLQLATAIGQKAGIIIMSSALWLNFLFRRTWFAQQASKNGTLASLFLQEWQTYEKTGDLEALERLQHITRVDKDLVAHCYVWRQPFEARAWRLFQHKTAPLMILIPEHYLREREDMVPRTAGKTYTYTEYATGLRLSELERLTLPTTPTEEDEAMLRIRQHIKHTTCTLEALTSLFIARQAVHPLVQVPWHVYMLGHGSFTAEKSPWKHLEPQTPTATPATAALLCGIPTPLFHSFLTWCNKHLLVRSWYYQSCYGGGKNLFQLSQAQQTVQETFQRTTHSLHFPLVSGALGDAPVYLIVPRLLLKHNGTVLTIATENNLSTYFASLAQEPIDWQSALRWIAPPFSTVQDPHGISNTPLVLLPGATQPLPIDVTLETHQTRPAALSKHALKAHLALFTSADNAGAHPFIVRGKRALLLKTPDIARPLEVHPYERFTQKQQNPHTTFQAPALISLLPGNAIHRIASLTLHDVGLKNFLTHSIIQSAHQKSTKVFLIDQLSVHNDLGAGATTQPSLWSRIVHFFSPLEPRSITTEKTTLSRVLIITGARRLTCYFCEQASAQSDDMRAYKITYQSVPKENKDHIRLPLTDTTQSRHKKLYAKYLKLWEKQCTYCARS